MLNPWVLIITSAILSALPLTFNFLFLISWVSFVPLFYVVFNHSNDKLHLSFRRGFLFGFVYHLCIYYWFLWFYPLDFANLTNGSSMLVVLLAWFGISVVHGVLWCIPTVLCGLVSRFSKYNSFLSYPGGIQRLCQNILGILIIIQRLHRIFITSFFFCLYIYDALFL